MIGFLLLIPSLVLNFFLWQRTEQGLKNDEGILVIADSTVFLSKSIFSGQ